MFIQTCHQQGANETVGSCHLSKYSPRPMRKLGLGMLVLFAACGPGDRPPGMGQDDAAPQEKDAPVIPPIDGPVIDNSKVYAHSGSVLFRVDTTTFQPMMIATLTGLGTSSLTDLAIDKDGNMVGVTLDSLFTINDTTGECTLIKKLTGNAQGLTSLSFIPADINDPNSADILASANDQGDVFKIDTATGTPTLLGNYGTAPGGATIVSSGDLIGVRGLGIYATVDVENEANDFIAKIDPATMKATLIGDTGFNNIFGLGFWGGTIYGFVDDKTSKSGKIITIDKDTGAGTVVDTGSVEWFGAGVTTDAPIIE